MIKSFKDSNTQAMFAGQRIPKFINIEAVVLRKLAMLHRAETINDLRIPSGNRLELLKGDRFGYHSIRINDQFRLCFKFENGNAFDVEIVDYH
jgi:proteic killer suppression protein